MKKLLILTIFLPSIAFAQVPTLSKVRVTYRPDGGVSITTFVAGACQGGENETQCMDREMKKNPELGNLPHDDILPFQLPQDRKDRDKWTGSKGQGVWIDHTKVTKEEKQKDLELLLDTELNKDNSDTVRIAKLQRLMEKLKEYNAPNGLIPPADLSKFDPEQPLTLGGISKSVGIKLSWWQSLRYWLLNLWR